MTAINWQDYKAHFKHEVTQGFQAFITETGTTPTMVIFDISEHYYSNKLEVYCILHNKSSINAHIQTRSLEKLMARFNNHPLSNNGLESLLRKLRKESSVGNLHENLCDGGNITFTVDYPFDLAYYESTEDLSELDTNEEAFMFATQIKTVIEALHEFADKNTFNNGKHLANLTMNIFVAEPDIISIAVS